MGNCFKMRANLRVLKRWEWYSNYDHETTVVIGKIQTLADFASTYSQGNCPRWLPWGCTGS